MAASQNVNVNLDSLIQGSNQLALKCHKVFAKERKSTFFSPFSVSSVVAMLLYGLRGETERELRECIGYTNIDNSVLANTFQSLLESLKNCPEGYTISNANSAVFKEGYNIFDQYKSDLMNYFKALCIEADFDAGVETTLDKINEWVEDNTNNKIKKLIPSLSGNEVAILLNAVYFKGSWLKQFKEKSTTNQCFYNSGKQNKARKVKMMHMEDHFPFAEKPAYKVLQLPYRGEEVAMLIFLPKTIDGLIQVEDLLAPNFISEIKKELHEREVEIALPKFKLEYSTDLKETFQNLGVNDMFREGADFGGMTDSKVLFVAKIIHKAVLEVNEEGCEAAAATAAIIKERCIVLAEEFIVDHPFAFVIYNIKNDLILFMGRVTEL